MKYCCQYFFMNDIQSTDINIDEWTNLPEICAECRTRDHKEFKQGDDNMNKKLNLKIENLEDKKLYKNQFCAVNTGETWKKYAKLEPEFYHREWFEEVKDVDSTPAKPEPDELDCFAETLLRAEWVKLVDRIAADPLLDDWILDLAVARCREIRKLLTKK